jgi:DNA-directed RNA polymerase subunit RPC12/RpoP
MPKFIRLKKSQGGATMWSTAEYKTIQCPKCNDKIAPKYKTQGCKCGMIWADERGFGFYYSLDDIKTTNKRQ